MEKEFIFKCKCGGHLVGVNTEFAKEDGEVYISFFQLVEWKKYGFWQRVKFLWNVLKGNNNYIFDVILSEEDCKELGNCLSNIKGEIS